MKSPISWLFCKMSITIFLFLHQSLSLLINNKITIKECFNKLNKTQEKLLIVINKSKNFIGVINDGDIRRALLNGV